VRKVEPSLMVKKDGMILEQYLYDKKQTDGKTVTMVPIG
jgi:hypothetical protein